MERVHIVGAGGIGCAVGHALAGAGLPVTMVEADPAKLDWGRRHGLRVDQQPALPAELVRFADWSPPQGATVLLCTKCYDNPSVLERIPASATLVPIQNGFDPLLESRAPALEGIASFVSECIPATMHTRITRPGKLHLGNRAGSGAIPSSSIVAPLLRSPLFRTEVVPNILPYKHTKLMYNAAISPLAAAAGIDNGQLLSVAVARRLFFALLRENYAILHGAGIELARIGPFHPATVQRILKHRLVARCLAWAFYPSLRGTYCSMAGDLPKGRTEIDYYNGHLIALAGDRPCPLNRRVCDLVKRLERERAVAGVAVLEELEKG